MMQHSYPSGDIETELYETRGGRVVYLRKKVKIHSNFYEEYLHCISISDIL